jgi:putative addiction module component (TIGR02574 family)
MTAEQITAEALRLPTLARAELAERLTESLDAADLTPIDKSWMSEARRRLDEILKGKGETVSGDEALARGRRVAAE